VLRLSTVRPVRMLIFANAVSGGSLEEGSLINLGTTRSSGFQEWRYGEGLAETKGRARPFLSWATSLLGIHLTSGGGVGAARVVA
jgi:hypothetical protein